LEGYVKQGGTLVVNIEAARKLPASLTGLSATGKSSTATTWRPAEGEALEAVPFDVAGVELKGAKALAEAGRGLPLVTRHAVGKGAVLVTLAPRMLGQDERAHPALPWLMNCLTDGLLPVEVRGEVMYQVNKVRDGYLVMLMNNRGVDKTQHGVARVDRRKFADVVVRTRLAVRSAREMTGDEEVKVSKAKGGVEVKVRVHPGDVQVVWLKTGGKGR
jgi:hypothetical protein